VANLKVVEVENLVQRRARGKYQFPFLLLFSLRAIDGACALLCNADATAMLNNKIRKVIGHTHNFSGGKLVEITSGG
jgi:hypothetical protein